MAHQLIKYVTALTICLFIVCGFDSLHAQEKQPDNKRMIKVTVPAETELKDLVTIISDKLSIHILYSVKDLGTEKIAIRFPKEIPADTLLDVLESALAMKSLALVDAEADGWKKIVKADKLTSVAIPNKETPIREFRGATAITQLFELKYNTPERISTIIKPFLTKGAEETIKIPAKNILIITDYAHNLKRIEKLIQIVDQTGPERELKTYQVEFMNASELANQISSAWPAQTSGDNKEISTPTISANKRTNQLFIVGTQVQVEKAIRLAKTFDISLNLKTEIYHFQYADAQRIDDLLQKLINPLLIERIYDSKVDKVDNMLIVTGNDVIHKKIEWLKEKMDVKTKRPGSAVKIYRLKYTDAEEVLNTLRAVQQQPEGIGSDRSRLGVSSLGRGQIGPARNTGGNDTPIDRIPAPNNPAIPGEQAPESPVYQDDRRPALFNDAALFSNIQAQGIGTIVPGDARVSVDPNSNSIIVIAERGVQQVYEDLITRLDKRQPQVMIEAKVVILDTSDDFSLGVELSAGDGKGARRLLQFTSFGLSQVDPISGALALIPGRGFNWTLVDPESADAVIRALTSHRRAKVVSAPRILVNDNATGTLASVTEVPFTSVNASNTVATTSFAGFAEAGTTIEVKPRITDDDNLQLEYNVSLNSFTGTGGEGVPPPRQTDQIISDVTIPDGYTVIVGGLTRNNISQTVDGLPFLEKIPIIRLLTSTSTESMSKTTLFIFLRPIILRDDKFRDLKYMSDRDLPRATEPGNFPKSTPLLVR